MATQRKKKMVTAVFRDHTNARAAYDYLVARGYTDAEINLLMSDKTRTAYYAEGREGKHSADTHGAEGVGIGGAIGTAVGAGLAAIAAVGTSLVIPGLGLVIAGPVVAALAGAGAGAVTGGLVGGLIGLGIPEDNAEAYHAALREGGVVLGVVPHSSDDADDIKDAFKNHGGENVIHVS